MSTIGKKTTHIRFRNVAYASKSHSAINQHSNEDLQTFYTWVKPARSSAFLHLCISVPLRFSISVSLELNFACLQFCIFQLMRFCRFCISGCCRRAFFSIFIEYFCVYASTCVPDAAFLQSGLYVLLVCISTCTFVFLI
jgi:hypothetical protein